MASIKSNGTWADLQESLTRVRQQYGLLPRAGWDDLIAMTSYEKAVLAKHRNKNLPRTLLPSLADVDPTSKSSFQLRKGSKQYIDLQLYKQHEERKSAKYDPVLHKTMLMKNQEREKIKSSLKLDEYRYFTENQHFAWDLVDSFVSEILLDEILPDVLIEALTNNHTQNTHMPPKKYYDKGQKIQWKPESGGSMGYFSMFFLDELLVEIVRDLSTQVLKRMVRSFADDHIRRTVLHDCIDEILTDIIQTELSSMTEELNMEIEHNRLEEYIIQSIINNEVEDIVLTELNKCDDQLTELHNNQITVTANKHIVDLFILEHLLGIIGTHETLMFGKDSSQCLLDGIIIDVLLRQHIIIQQSQQTTLENYPVRLFHQNTTSKVALEVILTELNMMLVEDMEDIFEYERDVELG